MKVGIVGAGVAGLATALVLQRYGIEFDIYDQASELKEVGAGVTLAANGYRLLSRVGLGEEIATNASVMDAGIGYYRSDGSLAVSIVDTDLDPGNTSYAMHRADLQRILSDAVPADRIHLSRKVCSVDSSSETAELEFAHGTKAKFDLVVGADGLNSVIRKFIAPGSTAVYSGYAAYRGLLPGGIYDEWPTGRTRLWMGDRRHFLVYGVRRDTLINFIGFVPRATALRQSWSERGNPTDLQREFSGWDPFVCDLLSHVTETFAWGLYDHEPITGWSRGNVLMIGDAAHPMLPHLGQGINQAIEDAFVLGRTLARSIGSTGHLDGALSAYETTRRARTDVVQRGSRDAGSLYEAESGADLDMRDTIVAQGATLRNWLYTFDADPDWNELGWKVAGS